MYNLKVNLLVFVTNTVLTLLFKGFPKKKKEKRFCNDLQS